MEQMMLCVARSAAWELGSATAAWGPGGADFHVALSSGRIVHVRGDAPRVVYEAECADPAHAASNPVCRRLQAPTPASR